MPINVSNISLSVSLCVPTKNTILFRELCDVISSLGFATSILPNVNRYEPVLDDSSTGDRPLNLLISNDIPSLEALKFDKQLWLMPHTEQNMETLKHFHINVDYHVYLWHAANDTSQAGYGFSEIYQATHTFIICCMIEHSTVV